jgi:hypothetical protein
MAAWAAGFSVSVLCFLSSVRSSEVIFKSLPENKFHIQKRGAIVSIDETPPDLNKPENQNI